MLLLAGLGNPGKKYQNNRHNSGFMLVDYLVENLTFPNYTKKFDSLFSLGFFQSTKVGFIKPQTFMNLSGNAIVKALNFYKIPASNLIVFYDDIDLNLGSFKYKYISGHGGHNGVRNIVDHLGSAFHKFKIGVGRPDMNNTVNHVLSDFGVCEKSDFIEPILNFSLNNFSYLINNDFEKFINLYHQ